MLQEISNSLECIFVTQKLHHLSCLVKLRYIVLISLFHASCSFCYCIRVLQHNQQGWCTDDMEVETAAKKLKRQAITFSNGNTAVNR